MNLVELIIWCFAATLSIGFAVGGYHLFDILGAMGGMFIGLLIGLVAGTGVSKLLYGFMRHRKRDNKIN